MELREYVATLRKQWWLVLALALVGAVAAFGYARSIPPEYRATSKVFVSLSHGSSVQELVQGSTYTQNLVASYAALASMPVVLDPVIDQLSLDTTPKALSRSILAETPLDTVIIQISVTTGTAEGAADIANAVAEQLSVTITDLSPESAEGEAVQVEVVSPAEVPGFPIAPNTRLLVLTGLLGGLAAGVLLALVRGLLDTRVRGPEDIAEVTDAALLGSIPVLRASQQGVVTAVAPRSVAAEAYRRLQTNLQFLDASGRLGAFVVTSALSGEGKTTTAVNLALTIAEKGRRVLLVDADLRRPAVATLCRLEEAAGLTTVLIGRARLAEVTQRWGHPTLDVLTLGELPPNPSQLIDSPAMAALIDEARRDYDLVILDAPPLLPVADATVLARATDGALVVADCRRLHRHQLAEALATLSTVDARCLGVVANRVPGAGAEMAYYGRGDEPRDRHAERSSRR